MTQIYSNNESLDELISNAVESIEQSAPLTKLTSMIKNAPTKILLASPNHGESRYQPGNELVTYTGIDDDNNLIRETWNDGVAVIKKNSVILRNSSPIMYGENSKNRTGVVQVAYSDDGTAVPVVLPKKVVAVENNANLGTLYNEYVSDVDWVKNNYGVQATTQWQSGLKLQPSFVFEIPSTYGDVNVITKKGIEISLKGGDYVVLDAKNDKVSSVHGIAKSWLDKTYTNMETYLKSLE